MKNVQTSNGDLNNVTNEEVIIEINKVQPSIEIPFGNKHSIGVQFNEFCRNYNAYYFDSPSLQYMSLESKKRRILQDKEVFQLFVAKCKFQQDEGHRLGGSAQSSKSGSNISEQFFAIQKHKLRLQQLKEPALGGTYIKITDSRKIDEEEFERGGSWPVSEGTEIIDLARVLDVQINIIEIIKFTDEQLQSMELGKDAKFTGTIREINQVKNAKRAVVNMVLSQGQYNPLLSKEPLTQGRSVKEIKESLNVLIDKKS